MRTLLFVPLFFVMLSSYALKMVALQSPSLVAQASLTTASEMPDDFRLPVHSTLSPGKVRRHRSKEVTLSQVLFVIGDDAFSRRWLGKHARHLKNQHALGLVTNVKSPDALAALEALAGMPLQPVMMWSNKSRHQS